MLQKKKQDWMKLLLESIWSLTERHKRKSEGSKQGSLNEKPGGEEVEFIG